MKPFRVSDLVRGFEGYGAKLKTLLSLDLDVQILAHECEARQTKILNTKANKQKRFKLFLNKIVLFVYKVARDWPYSRSTATSSHLAQTSNP